jgi:uncharacterized protein (TIGR03067 family)
MMTVTKLGRFAFVGLVLQSAAVGGAPSLPGRSSLEAASGLPCAIPVTDPEDDLNEIQGTWIRVSTDGRESDRSKMTVRRIADQPREDDVKGTLFKFDWDGTRSNLAGLKQGVRPKTVDFFVDVKRGVPKVCPGIYKIEGDVLTISFQAGGPERPRDFVAGRSGVTVDVYKRVKP